MNKLLVGIIVIVVGVAVGWYYLGGKSNLPGMQIGNTGTPSANGATGGNVVITEESPVTGESKGGVVEAATIAYTDTGYQPATVTVKAGTKVTFKNESAGGMWTASGVHPTHQLLPGFDQLKSVTTGGMYEYTFVKVGTWKYHNHVKPEHTGTVVVTN